MSRFIYEAPKAHSKKVVAKAERRERVYKRTAKPSVAFCYRGGARKRADVFLEKEKRSKANFAPTWSG